MSLSPGIGRPDLTNWRHEPSQEKRSNSFNEIATVRIELQDTDPVIWRQVEVPTSITLKVLHDIVQAVMGWCDDHLWEFTIGRQKYGLPTDEDWGTEPRIDAGKVRLRDVLKPQKNIIDYLYDFGDCWEHRIAITNIHPVESGVSYPRYRRMERASRGLRRTSRLLRNARSCRRSQPPEPCRS